MKLLEIVRQHIPSLKKAYFWSDGCTAQFHSRFPVHSITFYPNDLELSWDYGEAHHFKGTHDDIEWTVKRKVYEDVTASKVIIRMQSILLVMLTQFWKYKLSISTSQISLSRS